MRKKLHNIRSFALSMALAAFALPAHASSPEQARQFTYEFLRTYVQAQPGLYDMQVLEPYLGEPLRASIAHAIAAEAASAAITPAGDKPCLWEGDVFFGFYEGVTEYRLTDARRDGRGYAVRAEMNYHEAQGEDFNWPVTILLDDEPLRVRDVIRSNGPLLSHDLNHACEYELNPQP